MLALWRANNRFMEFKCPHIPAVYRRHRTFSAEFYQTKSVPQINPLLFSFLPATGPCVIWNDAWIQRSDFGSTVCGQSRSAQTDRKLHATHSVFSCCCFQNKSSAFCSTATSQDTSVVKGCLTRTNIYVMHINIMTLHAKKKNAKNVYNKHERT